jgi:hypothetical protein
VCADIRDGREQLFPSKGRIQMCKTNYLQTVISDLQRTAGPYRCANIGLMHCGKSHPAGSPRPHARIIASNPLIVMRGMKYLRSMKSRATSSTKPPPTAASRERARRQSAGMWRRLAEKRAVLGHCHSSGNHSCFCPAPGGTQAAVELPMVLPIRILQLSPASQQLIDNN